MQLLRLSAHFGVLDGQEFRFDQGTLNLIVDDNERGKSTFVAALVAALYGLSGYGATSDQHHYQPLTGNRFDVELDITVEFDAGQRRLRVRRDFGRGTCSVSDLDTVEDVTGQFQSGKSRWDIGRPLLGLSRDQFLRSALVRQGEIGGLGLDKQAATLTSRIQQLVDTSAGDHTAAAAITALDEALRGYVGLTFKTSGNVNSEIEELIRRIDGNECRLTDLRLGRAALDTDAARMARLHAGAAVLRQRRDNTAARADQIDAHRAAVRLRQDGHRRDRHDALDRERAALADLPELDARLADELAALDGAIGSLDRRIADERDAVSVAAAASNALAEGMTERQQFAGTTAETAHDVVRAYDRLCVALDSEATARSEVRTAEAGTDRASAALAGRFERLSSAEIDDLSRYGERRSDLLSASAALHPSGAIHLESRSRFALIAAIGLIVTGVVLLLLLPPAPGILLALVGAGLAAWSLLHRTPALSGQSGAAREQAHQALRVLDERTAAIASGLGYNSIAPVLDGLRAWQDTRARHEQLRAVRRQHDEAAATVQVARRMARALLARWCRPGSAAVPDSPGARTFELAESNVDPDQLLALHVELNAYLRDHAALAQAQELETAVRQRLEQICRERATAVASFARAAGTDAATADQRTAAREHAGELLAAHARRQALSVQIAEIEAGLLAAPERNRLLQVAALATADAAMPPVAPGTSERAGEAGTDGGDWQEEGDERTEVLRLGARVEQYEAEAGELRARLAVSLNDFERTYPAVEAALAEQRNALARASGFATSAGLAREVLAEVARETHRDWSRRLNEATSAILDRFATEHTEVRFSEQLEFVLRDRVSGHEWSRADVDRRLSAGARDQVYLAIRFALAGYFSPMNDPLPLILDDPLVTSDDTRFAAVMTYLAEQARTRQVIVLTCHAERHRNW